MGLFIVLFLLSLTQIALGQDAAAPVVPPDMFIEKSFLDTILSGTFAAKALALMVAIQVLLYGLGEGLTRLSVLTENKWDNKVANWISNAAWVLGSVCGKLGYSTPKLVIEEKAKELNEKKQGA